MINWLLESLNGVCNTIASYYLSIHPLADWANIVWLYIHQSVHSHRNIFLTTFPSLLQTEKNLLVNTPTSHWSLAKSTYRRGKYLRFCHCSVYLLCTLLRESVARWWFIVISSSWYPKHLKKLMNLLRAALKLTIPCVVYLFVECEPRKWWISIAAPVLVSQDNAEWFFIVILDARLYCIVDSIMHIVVVLYITQLCVWVCCMTSYHGFPFIISASVEISTGRCDWLILTL